VDPREDEAVAEATEAVACEARRDGLSLAFERMFIAGDAAVASFRGQGKTRKIVKLEWTGKVWDVLGSTVLGPVSWGSPPPK
jgi:hypothetical protein